MHDNSTLTPEHLTVKGRTYRVANLSFEDLRYRFATGQAYTKFGSGKDRVLGYRHGVMTRIGDLEDSVWEQLMLDLIHRSEEDTLLHALTKWVAASCPWFRTQREIERYALELYSERIFENPEWVGYAEFNDRYLPQYKKESQHEHKKVP